MKTTFLIAASAAGGFALSASIYAQDMQMTPAQTGTAQQSAQAVPTDPNSSSYGGAMAGSESMSVARDAWSTPTGTQCTPELSCNIYQGQ